LSIDDDSSSTQQKTISSHVLTNLHYILLGLSRMSTPANPKSGYFLEIRSSLAPAKFLAGFAGCQCSYIQLITGTTNAAALSTDVFAILMRVNAFIAVPQISPNNRRNVLCAKNENPEIQISSQIQIQIQPDFSS